MVNHKRGSPLSERQIGGLLVIKQLIAKGQKLSFTKIGKLIESSRQTVRDFLKNPKGYGLKKKTGRPQKYGPRFSRRIVRSVKREEGWTSSAILSCEFNISRSTISRILKKKEIKWTKAEREPDLKDDDHRKARLNWSLDFLKFPLNDLKKIIFTDEKRFNLDGPDGLDFYYKVPGSKSQFKVKHQFGGGSIMIWAGMSYYGQSRIAFCSGHMDRFEYMDVLSENLLPFGDFITGHGWILQQDNCSVHLAKDVKVWFEENDIKCIKWPSISPDLNPIENLWAILCRIVYQNGKKQFSNIGELKEAILESWKKISKETLQNLVFDMPKRFVKCIRNGGNHIHR